MTLADKLHLLSQEQETPGGVPAWSKQAAQGVRASTKSGALMEVQSFAHPEGSLVSVERRRGRSDFSCDTGSLLQVPIDEASHSYALRQTNGVSVVGSGTSGCWSSRRRCPRNAPEPPSRPPRRKNKSVTRAVQSQRPTDLWQTFAEDEACPVVSRPFYGEERTVPRPSRRSRRSGSHSDAADSSRSSVATRASISMGWQAEGSSDAPGVLDAEEPLVQAEAEPIAPAGITGLPAAATSPQSPRDSTANSEHEYWEAAEMWQSPVPQDALVRPLGAGPPRKRYTPQSKTLRPSSVKQSIACDGSLVLGEPIE